jgi:glutathione S-transferase
MSMDFVRRAPTPALDGAAEADVARVIEAWTEALKHHSGSRGFLFGRFSIADAMYAPVVSRFTTYGIEVPAIVQAYMDKIWALPAMQDWKIASQAEVDAGIA